MQQQRQQEDAEPDGEEEGINPSLYAEMVKSLISKYEFEGEAAELVGQVGLQPELGVKCRCCGEAERRKTLICDACENSFHLKCLKLRLSHALLLDHWLCMDLEGEFLLQSSSPMASVYCSHDSCNRDADTHMRRLLINPCLSYKMEQAKSVAAMGSLFGARVDAAAWSLKESIVLWRLRSRRCCS